MHHHIHHRSPSASQLSHKSHSTLATSPSHVGSKSTASGARYTFGARSQIFGKAQSRESLRESASLSEGEDHVQKRKSESFLGSQPRLLPCSDSYAQILNLLFSHQQAQSSLVVCIQSAIRFWLLTPPYSLHYGSESLALPPLALTPFTHMCMSSPLS